jgi:hypothetical protein
MHEEAFYIFYAAVLSSQPHSRQHLGLNRNVFLCCFLKGKKRGELVTGCFTLFTAL